VDELLLLLEDLKVVYSLQFNKVCQLFSSNFRIKNTEEFDAVLKGTPFKSKFFLLFKNNNNLGFSRLGIVISKKIIHKAVSRNYLKRMIRETFRLSNLSNRSVDIIIVVRSQPLTTLEGNLTLKKLFMQI